MAKKRTQPKKTPTPNQRPPRVKRPSRVRMRGLARDYLLEYMEENPGASTADAVPVVKDRIRADFGNSPFLDFLLSLIELLAPLLIPLLLEKPPTPSED